MPDWQATRIDGTPAEQAVHYALQRVANDRNFSWLMIGTQTLRLCIQAEAARTGKTEAVVESELETACQRANQWLKRHGQDTPEVCQLRERIAALETELRGKELREAECPRRETALTSLPDRQWWEH